MGVFTKYIPSIRSQIYIQLEIEAHALMSEVSGLKITSINLHFNDKMIIPNKVERFAFISIKVHHIAIVLWGILKYPHKSKSNWHPNRNLRQKHTLYSLPKPIKL